LIASNLASSKPRPMGLADQMMVCLSASPKSMVTDLS
jgi:hypothetical protein